MTTTNLAPTSSGLAYIVAIVQTQNALRERKTAETLKPGGVSAR